MWWSFFLFKVNTVSDRLAGNNMIDVIETLLSNYKCIDNQKTSIVHFTLFIALMQFNKIFNLSGFILCFHKSSPMVHP